MLEIFTFGDSWTAGAGLKNPETDYFGAVLADKLNARVHNYGVEGSSVSGAINLLEENLDAIISADAALVILTFTENARDIDCYSERQFNYISAYKDKTFDYAFYNSVLDDIEQEWIDRLNSIKFPDTVKVVAGFNFAWHDRLAEFCKQQFTFIDQPWTTLLGNPNKLPRTSRVSALETIHTLTGVPVGDSYKQWAVDTISRFNSLLDWSEQSAYFDAHDTGHPNPAGHYVWAERILCEL